MSAFDSSTTDPATATAQPVRLSPEEQLWLGKLARLSIERRLAAGGQSADVPVPDLPPDSALFAELGAFVTLTIHGNLRGCIGSMTGQGPLHGTIARMACAAAFEDPRFPPLQPAEWPACDLDISVLGPLSLCPDPRRIEIGRHGLLLARGNRSGVFLPQVPVEQRWDLHTYLEQLCVKAGLPPHSWLAPDSQLYWYEAFVFTPPQA